MPKFTVIVEDTFAVRGRGTMITGVIAEGELPPLGTTVAIHAEGRPTIYALFSGIPMLPPHPREQADMLLRGLSKEDVPIGSRITDAPAEAATGPLP